MTATIHPFRSVNADSITQAALAALGRVERVSVVELRQHLAIARTGRAICDELYEQMKLTGMADPTPTQDAAYTAAERAEEAAHQAITALFAGLTAQERRQLGGIL